MTNLSESLARLRVAYQENFDMGVECGSALCVWHEGREVLHLFGGFRDAVGKGRWGEDTAVLVWSATKGPASACVAHALHEAGLSMTTPVARVWPEFAQNGKDAVTMGDILSHRAGLAAVADRSIPALDHDAVAAALAAQKPAWPPGTAHGYGPRAFGYLIDEIVRRLTGKRCGEYWRAFFGEPLGLDFWMGIPESEHGRVAQCLGPRATAAVGERTPFTRAIATPGSITHAAFSGPGGITGPTAMNSPAMRSACLPAFGGIGTARALAKFYGLLAVGADGLFGGVMREAFSERQVNGFDLVLQRDTAFSTGFMLDPVEGEVKLRSIFGPARGAFGHPGAGGSLAFADPANSLGFAYVVNQMEPGAFPRERTRRLVRALYGM